MRRTLLLLVVIALAVTVLSAVAQSQGPGGRGMGMGPYDVKTETTVTGTVQAVQLHPGRGRGMGTHLLLKTKDATLDVHVGPSTYIEKQGFAFTEGDTVEVTGSMVKTKDAILARSIKKNDKTLTLRDDTGKPLWAKGPKRPN
ncbi:MAG TPA: hypothetical protein VF135_12150 [Terriglobales bacterium]